MKTFNKKGDRGETSLLFGKRVRKDDLRCEAYGTLDEAASALGIARNVVSSPRTRELIIQVQKELFQVNAEMATMPEDLERLASTFKPINEAMADRLEQTIVELEGQIEMPREFIIPGGTLASAWLDLARTIVRRGERRAVSLKESGELKNEAVLKYLNRLADLLFTLARYEETLAKGGHAGRKDGK